MAIDFHAVLSRKTVRCAKYARQYFIQHLSVIQHMTIIHAIPRRSRNRAIQHRIRNFKRFFTADADNTDSSFAESSGNGRNGFSFLSQNHPFPFQDKTNQKAASIWFAGSFSHLFD